jgi:hypothetical protein
MEDDFAELRRLSFMESRIPALDALEGFVPTGGEGDPAVEAAQSLTGFSRWRSVEGGHEVQFLYEGGNYDTSRFRLMKGAWDHEICKRCAGKIEAMSPCFVTSNGPYVILCETCHALVARSSADGDA